jgi:hypothetical protein
LCDFTGDIIEILDHGERMHRTYLKMD